LVTIQASDKLKCSVTVEKGVTKRVFRIPISATQTIQDLLSEVYKVSNAKPSPTTSIYVKKEDVEIELPPHYNIIDTVEYDELSNIHVRMTEDMQQ
jgi:hypothetical protein